MTERTPQDREQYAENRHRVREIYGVGEDEDYTIHHIVFRRDGGGDEKANLVPLKREDHARLHAKIDRQEDFINQNKGGKIERRPT